MPPPAVILSTGLSGRNFPGLNLPLVGLEGKAAAGTSELCSARFGIFSLDAPLFLASYGQIFSCFFGFGDGVRVARVRLGLEVGLGLRRSVDPTRDCFVDSAQNRANSF